MIPVVNYIVFGGESQMQTQRNSVTYDKDMRRATIEEGLAVYQSYASQLVWSEYFALVKKLLHKLSKSRNVVNSVASRGEPEL